MNIMINTLDAKLEEARKDLSSYLKSSDKNLNIVPLRSISDKGLQWIVTIDSPTTLKHKTNKEGETVSLSVLFDEREDKGTQKVRITVHGRFRNDIGSIEAVMRASDLCSLVHGWVKDKADYIGKEYARDESPQERYFMR